MNNALPMYLLTHLQMNILNSLPKSLLIIDKPSNEPSFYSGDESSNKPIDLPLFKPLKE